MEQDPTAQPRCVPATRGYTLGYVDRWEGRFHPYSPGTRYQARCQHNVYLRDCWSYYEVVGFGTIGSQA